MQSRKASLKHLLFLVGGTALGLQVGCSAQPVTDSAASGPGSAAGGSGGSSSGGTGVGGAGGSLGGTGGVGIPTTTCPTPALPRSPLRRLTRFEYQRTVEDLLKVDGSAALELPTDEISNAFDNNANVLTVSALHAEKYALVSEALAAQAVLDLPGLTECDPVATGEEACALAFAQRFGRRAFRRPLTSADEALLMSAYELGRTALEAGGVEGSYQEGIEVMVRAILQSPHFLYRLELVSDADASATLVPLSPFELATRLSFLIWSTGPDDALLDAAERGELTTPEQVAQKAREMMTSPRALASVTRFFQQWSSLSRLDITSKSSTRFPAFTPELAEAMGRELPDFLNYLITEGDRSLSTLFTSNVSVVTPSLAAYYGVEHPDGQTPQLVTLPEAQGRAGLLTQPGFLSVQAHPDQTSPVLRGKFVRAMLLCDPPEPPPDNIDISLPEVDQGGTARERFSGHLSAGAVCSGCHALMDPIGFAFEHFDAAGQYRADDGGQLLDVSGEMVEVSDPALQGPFVGVRELSEKLAASELVRDCVATQYFRFAAGRLEADGDACSIATLQEAFDGSQGDLVELVVGLTQTEAFLFRGPVTP